jgi:DNA-binding response OmpR family regulator
MPEKILIVDDDLDTIQFLQILLNRQGYHVVMAKDGLEALRIANQELPDLIVLDVMMPALNGFEVARRLHRRPETALIPILMFTARSQPEDKVNGYEAGVDLYLTKPVHPLDLQANIKALLLHRKARKAVQTERGHLVGVIGAKGGVGISTVALNLAVMSARQYKIKPIAVELRPGQGTWLNELNLPASYHLVNLLRMNSSEITQTQVESQLTDTKFGVRLLLAGSCSSKDIGLASAISQYDTIVQNLTLMSRLVVLDIGTTFLPAYSLLLEQCDELIVVTEPGLLSVRKTAFLLEELHEKGFGTSKMLSLVTLNHTHSDSVMGVSQIESCINHPIALGIPPALELANRALQLEAPLCLVQPEALVSTQFIKLAEIIARHAVK